MSYISDINNAIAQSVATVKANFKKNGLAMQEPDYVAALTTEFPKIIAGLIPGVRYGGCFIHQKPKISFTSTSDGSQHSCEVGDLLIICRKNVDDTERYNAALLQFKRSNSKHLTISAKPEEVQLEVYTSWPKFTIANIGQFDIQPKTVNLGAQYSLIYESAGQYRSMYVHIPQKLMTFSSDLTLGRFINDLMDWQDGRTINEESKKDEEEWSRLIWDLVSVLKTAVMNSRRTQFFDKKPRSSGEFFDLMCDADPIILVPKNGEENAENGISLLFVDDKRQDINPQGNND